MAPWLPSMVRSSVMSGSAAVSLYTQNFARLSVSPPVLSLMALESAAALQGTLAVGGAGLASAIWADPRPTAATTAPAAVILAAVFANFRCIISAPLYEISSVTGSAPRRPDDFLRRADPPPAAPEGNDANAVVSRSGKAAAHPSRIKYPSRKVSRGSRNPNDVGPVINSLGKIL